MNGGTKELKDSSKSFLPYLFFSTTYEKFLYNFYVYMNTELSKELHVHFYFVNETEKTHHHHICQQNTTYVFKTVFLFLFCIL